jgi:hypothetical protein
MSMAIERNFTLAWYEGLSMCGILPDETTPEEDARLRIEINTEIGYLYGLAEDISHDNRDSGGKLRVINKRLEMWTNKYGMIRDLAKSYACQDEKLKWVMDVLKEHCSDCLNLDGRVYRASIWRQQNIYPRMPSLECKGYHCGCEFVSTSEPVTRGRPLSI